MMYYASKGHGLQPYFGYPTTVAWLSSQLLTCAMREGLKLCLHRGYIHAVLHLYNFLRQAAPRALRKEIPVLELLQQVFIQEVFRGELPTNDFYASLRTAWGGTTVAGRMSLDDRETGIGFREPWDIEPEVKPEALSDVYTLLVRGSNIGAAQEMVSRHRVRMTGELSNNRMTKARRKVERMETPQLLAEAKAAAAGELREPTSFVSINGFTVHALLVDALLAVGDAAPGDAPRTPRRASSWVDSVFAHISIWEQRFGNSKLGNIPPIRRAAEALEGKLGNVMIEEIRWVIP